MANMMLWSCLGLLLPSLTLAAVFNWNRHGEPADNTLRFEPRNKDHDGIIVSRPPAHSGDAPAFCNKLDCPKFTVIMNGTGYQLREYEASGWVSTTSIGVDYDKASYTDFMRLFGYISGKNKKKQKIAMTAPVLNSITPGQGPTCADNFTMSFFMVSEEPPQPSEKDVFLSRLPGMRVYVRYFPGFADKDKWLQEAVQLADDLEGKDYVKDYYYTAGYNSPFQFTDRHNEIWFIAK